MRKYKLIIFDFGGVLYNIDYYASTHALAKLSAEPDILDSMDLNNIMHLPADFEKGHINENDFRNFLRDKYRINAGDIIIDTAWNAMLLGLKAESASFVRDLQKRNYRTALLSNTNSIHYKSFMPESAELFKLFEKIFLSYEIGMRKPDSEIFEFVCRKMSIFPSECLFIDDSLINIEAAKSTGMDTFHFTEKNSLSDLLHTI